MDDIRWDETLAWSWTCHSRRREGSLARDEVGEVSIAIVTENTKAKEGRKEKKDLVGMGGFIYNMASAIDG